MKYELDAQGNVIELEFSPYNAGFKDGYGTGKDKAYAEIRAVLSGTPHAPTCGCQPCILIREIARLSGWTVLLQLAPSHYSLML